MRMEIGTKIKSYRNANKLTQRQLAEKVGLTSPTITKYEKGLLEPNMSTLNKLSIALGVNVSDLLPEPDFMKEIKLVKEVIMKGKELTAEEVGELKENTKIVFKYGKEEILSEVKHELFYIDGLKKDPQPVGLRYLTKSKDGCSWSSSLNMGKYYEWKEDVKMKTYKTWEVIKLLTENPKLQFENDSYNSILKTDLKYSAYLDLVNKGTFENKKLEIYLGLDHEWTLIKQPVSFMEAVKAFKEGKTIKSVCNTSWDSYSPDQTDFMEITPEEILEGKWYIEY